MHLSRNVRKRTFGHVRPVKIQIGLNIRAIWAQLFKANDIVS